MMAHEISALPGVHRRRCFRRCFRGSSLTSLARNMFPCARVNAVSIPCFGEGLCCVVLCCVVLCCVVLCCVRMCFVFFCCVVLCCVVLCCVVLCCVVLCCVVLCCVVLCCVVLCCVVLCCVVLCCVVLCWVGLGCAASKEASRGSKATEKALLLCAWRHIGAHV